MSVDVQGVIRALIHANEAPALDDAKQRNPVITISRDLGSGGTPIAHALAERMGVRVYDKQVLESIAKHAKVNNKLMTALHETVTSASDAWLYAMVFGKNVTRDDYRKALVASIRAIYRTGGVVLGRGGHVILSGRDVLRLRITASDDVCAKRVALERHMEIAEALKEIKKTNKKRSKYVWDTFQNRLNDATAFDLTLNTDNFADYGSAVELIWGAMVALGYDNPKSAVTTK